jgi:hypothetical protein
MSNNPNTTDDITMLDIFRDGVKIGETPDIAPDFFENDAECIEFLKELKNLPELPVKYVRTIDNCVAVLTNELDKEVPFGPFEILRLAELAFRYFDHGAKIMSAVRYLSCCVEFTGSLPPDIFAKLGSTFGLLGSIANKPVNDDDEDAYLDDDDEFSNQLRADSDDSDDDE